MEIVSEFDVTSWLTRIWQFALMDKLTNKLRILRGANEKDLWLSFIQNVSTD